MTILGIFGSTTIPGAPGTTNDENTTIVVGARPRSLAGSLTGGRKRHEGTHKGCPYDLLVPNPQPPAPDFRINQHGWTKLASHNQQ